METVVRKPLQGVINVIRFNWHFYVFAGVVIICLYVLYLAAPLPFASVCMGVLVLTATLITLSLLVSCYVYDFSGLYNLDWLTLAGAENNHKIVNINAGFDETSAIIKNKFPKVSLHVFDFYDPARHTEVSIERARKAYPPYPGTVRISTESIPLSAGSVDLILNVFSLHEIRNENERVNFLKLQYDILRPGGRCVVAEHQRDLPNWIAYNIGFFHFYSPKTWASNFARGGFDFISSHKFTPFVTVYILRKDYGITS